eukprot:CAMPEP_0181298316 /NCGR_PEP_ID=MMETSP1101-20121128/5717_1 /TAXON_ID=46948 /ORGANISM="Rhodomonas abbreviata, Strain Caron Lab Isolate" /LENGTH=84 /DNA_ID=CAMNT_0023403329 /DNA_START=133 /DNA_END=384 /DNA_ORIENTATION=-
MSNDNAFANLSALGGNVAICVRLSIGLAWLILVAVFLSRHDDFCNKYWEQVQDNGVYYGINDEQYFPNMGGRPKTELWLLLHVC